MSLSAHHVWWLPLLSAVVLPACFTTSDDTKPRRDETEAPDTQAEDPDEDGDGYAASRDCDDDDDDVNPGAEERANDVDDDCDGDVDEGTNRYDDDGDGYAERDGDCDDDDDNVNPGENERANSVDDDCDGRVDEGTNRYDDDGDGYTENGGDCDDSDDDTYPGAPEDGEDGVDHDCDGEVTDPGPTFCGLDISCPSSLWEIGDASMWTTEYWSFTWTYSAECGRAVGGPIFANATSDLHSIGFTAVSGSDETQIGYLEMGGIVYVDSESGIDDLYSTWMGDQIAKTVVLPSDLYTSPPDGCTVVVPVADASLVGDSARLYMASRRYSSADSLIFNFVDVGGTTLSSTDMSYIRYYLEAYLGNAGIGVSSVGSYALTSRSADITTAGSEINAIRSASVAGDGRAINVFFVDAFTDSSLVLGIAGGVPGPLAVVQTSASGVVIALDPMTSGGTIDWRRAGQVIAHEAGHQLGLFHTTEAAGTSHDPLSDTPECPSTRDSNGSRQVDASECGGAGAEYVMFWQSGDLDAYNYLWSTQQAYVMYSSPVAVN